MLTLRLLKTPLI